MKAWDIQLFELNFDEREKEAVAQTLDSGWITSGPNTAKFESNFEIFSDSNYQAVAVSSCTAALHLSLLAANVGSGDEVVISALTFVAAANVVRQVGGKVVLADCHSQTDWNVSIDSIRAVVTAKTKAVIVVHFAGEPCADIKEIADYCHIKGITLIEDVAHAPGATVCGQHCGTFGDFGCFSFFTNKNISMGEGGLVLCKHADDKARIARLRSHGMTVGTLDRYRGKALSYDVAESGLNYRIDELRAAIGIVQLEKFVTAQAKREWLVDLYSNTLEGCKGVHTYKFNKKTGIQSSYHIFPVLLSSRIERAKFMQHLKSSGIQTSIHYPALSSFSGLKDQLSGHDALACEISNREVTLPLHTNLKKEEVIYICDTIKEYVDV